MKLEDLRVMWHDLNALFARGHGREAGVATGCYGAREMSEAPAPNLAQLRWRFACIGLALASVSFAVGVSALAYGGKLPTWIPAAPGFDKLGHFVIFAGVAFFADGALGYRALLRRAPWLRLGPVLVWVPVAIDEWAQRFSTRRTPELLDLLADTLGVVIGAWVSFAIHRWLGRRDGVDGDRAPATPTPPQAQTAAPPL